MKFASSSELSSHLSSTQTEDMPLTAKFEGASGAAVFAGSAPGPAPVQAAISAKAAAAMAENGIIRIYPPIDRPSGRAVGEYIFFVAVFNRQDSFAAPLSPVTGSTPASRSRCASVSSRYAEAARPEAAWAIDLKKRRMLSMRAREILGISRMAAR